MNQVDNLIELVETSQIIIMNSKQDDFFKYADKYLEAKAKLEELFIDTQTKEL